MKKIYITPQTEIFDIEATGIMAGSPPSTIVDPTIENSREIYNELWETMKVEELNN